MVELLGAGGLELDVVGSPSHAELLARRQLTDDVGEGAVVRVAACLSARDGHGVRSTFSQSTHKAFERWSRKAKRARFNAQAGIPVIASTIRATLGRTRYGADLPRLAAVVG